MNDALKKRYPQNRVIKDDAGRGSVMVYVPKFDLCDVIPGAPQVPHPAFVVDGKVLSGIYVSKFQNVVAEGRAYSLPDLDPATGIDFDEALQASAAKGDGWHLMTAMEWGAIALWCRKNGWLPLGNNDLGKDVRETEVVAEISYHDEEKGICRTATGTGPVTWSHNGRADGIYDLNGNVWEWNGGVRLVHGEVQILPDNNGANSGYAQGADSDAWRAIDGKTGAYVLPGTAHSVKLDYVDGVFAFAMGEVSDSYAHARFCDFGSVGVADNVCERAKLLLTALGLLPCGDAALYEGVALYANNGSAERMIFRGGRWGQGLNAGVFKTCIDDPRSYKGDAVGFRAAYYERPEKG